MDHFCYLRFVLICHTVLSVPCIIMITCLERADILALLCEMFLVFFVTFPYGVLGQEVWYLIVSIPGIYLLPCNKENKENKSNGMNELVILFYKWAVACDFQQCGILTSIDSYEHVQPPIKLRNSK